MKAKLQITTAFLLFFSNIYAQDYYPLFDESTWTVSDWVSCCRESITHTINDGVEANMGSFTYRKIHDPFEFNGIDTVYVREDIAERKIYRLTNGVDKLIYDFSLENGETITLNDKTFAATVDVLMTEAGARKRIVLNTVNEYNGHILTQTWIEGVGTTAHPFYPDCNMNNVMSSGGGWVLTTRCGFQKQIHIYGNPELCGTTMSTPENIDSGRRISIVPNPVVSDITIIAEFELQNATLKLFDIRGQLLRETGSIKGSSFTQPRENLPGGIYFVQLSENGTIIWTDKLVVR